LNKKLNNNLILPKIVNYKNYERNVYVDAENKEWIIKKNNIYQQEKMLEIKPKRDCVSAQEYFSQFSNSKEKYNLKEIKIILRKVSLCLRSKEIFLIYSGWESVWENSEFSMDCAEEIICAKYSNLVKERFERYKKYIIGNKKPFYNIPIIYLREIISFIVVSDYELYLSKLTGLLHIKISFMNNCEKKICITIFKEILGNRIIIENNMIIIKLNKY